MSNATPTPDTATPKQVTTRQRVVALLIFIPGMILVIGGASLLAQAAFKTGPTTSSSAATRAQAAPPPAESYSLDTKAAAMPVMLQLMSLGDLHAKCLTARQEANSIAIQNQCGGETVTRTLLEHGNYPPDVYRAALTLAGADCINKTGAADCNEVTAVEAGLAVIERG